MDQSHPHHAAHVVFGVAGAALASVIAFHVLFYSHQYGFALGLFLLILAGTVIGLYAFGGRRGNAWAFVFLAPFLLSLVAALYASEVVRFFGLSCPSVRSRCLRTGLRRSGPVPRS